MLYDAAGHELLILFDGLFAFDLETSGCTKLPSQLIPLGIALTHDGRLLASDFNQLMQLDMQSADAVIVLAPFCDPGPTERLHQQVKRFVRKLARFPDRSAAGARARRCL